MKRILNFVLALVFVLGICFSAPISVNAVQLSESQKAFKDVKIEEYNTIDYKLSAVKKLAKPVVKTSSTTSGIKLTWDKIENAKNYIVYRRVYNTKTKKYSSWTTLNKAYTQNSYIDKSVKLGTTYSYTVRAVNGDVKSGYTATSNIIFNVIPTVQISNVSNGISVKWSKIPSATGYTVYSATYNSKTKKWSGWTNRGTAKSSSESWTDKKVKNGTIYRYTVRAVYSGGKTGYKATRGLRFLTQPTVKIANASNGVKVSWNKNTSATGYTVYRAILTNGKWSSWKNMGTAKSNVLSWVDKSAVSGEIYRYTVRTVNGGSKSSYKATENLMFLSQPKVTVSTSANGVKVNWTESAGAIKYAVYRSECIDGEWTSWFKISTTSSLALTDGDALKGVKYKYTVRAINGDYKSTYKASSEINGCVISGSQGSTAVTPGGTQQGGTQQNTPKTAKECLDIYTTVINKAKVDKVAYSKNVSRELPGDVNSRVISKGDGLFGTLLSLVDSLGVMESNFEINESGSDMRSFPIYNCEKGCYLTDVNAIKSYKYEDLGGDKAKVTIVLNDEKNPEPMAEGASISPSYTGAMFSPLSRKTIDQTINGEQVSSVIKNVTYDLTYHDCTAIIEYNIKTNELIKLEQYMYVSISGTGKVMGVAEIVIDKQEFINAVCIGANDPETDYSNDSILKDPLEAYRKATKTIHENGVAGYTKKGWQIIEKDFQFSNNALSSSFSSVLESFLTPESEAQEKVNAKGSDDAKMRMPISNCSREYVKSATAKKIGDYYLITIVMKDQLNPSYDDLDGLAKMSREILDAKDVEKTLKDDATVSKLVKDLDTNIYYKDYTITAKMNAKGKLIEITHYGVGYMDMEMNISVGGNVSGSGAILFNAKYYNFQY